MHGLQEVVTQSHRSVSQLTTYSDCSERYYLERVAKVPQVPAAWTIQGVAVHAAVESFERSYRSMSVSSAQDVFLDTWESEMEKAIAVEPNTNRWIRGGRKSGDDDIEQREALGLTQVHGYIEHALASPLRIMTLPDDTPAVEVPFRVLLGGVEVHGYIDQILEDPDTGALVVRDIKTGREPAWPLQLGVYRLAVLDTLGTDIRWGDYYLAKDGRTSGPVDLPKRFPGDTVAMMFAALDHGISQGVYLPNPQSCFPCSVKAHCPVYKF